MCTLVRRKCLNKETQMLLQRKRGGVSEIQGRDRTVNVCSSDGQTGQRRTARHTQCKSQDSLVEVGWWPHSKLIVWCYLDFLYTFIISFFFLYLSNFGYELYYYWDFFSIFSFISCSIFLRSSLLFYLTVLLQFAPSLHLIIKLFLYLL